MSNEPSQPRYERKFVFEKASFPEVEQLVRLHSALFVERYPARQVNNIYLDSFDLANRTDSVEGTRDRVKVRYRWYGDLLGAAVKPTLELKIKRGALGTKISAPLGECRFGWPLPIDTLRSKLPHCHIYTPLADAVTALEATVVNRYRRHYYESADRRFRLTIDDQMTYYRPTGATLDTARQLSLSQPTVLKLKYGPDADTDSGHITQAFPTRLTRMSKYVSGLNCL